jgi:hypothetical protein
MRRIFRSFSLAFLSCVAAALPAAVPDYFVTDPALALKQAVEWRTVVVISVLTGGAWKPPAHDIFNKKHVLSTAEIDQKIVSAMLRDNGEAHRLLRSIGAVYTSAALNGKQVSMPDGKQRRKLSDLFGLPSDNHGAWLVIYDPVGKQVIGKVDYSSHSTTPQQESETVLISARQAVAACSRQVVSGSNEEFGGLTVRFIHPEPIPVPAPPAIFACFQPGTQHVDPAIFTALAARGFVVIQVVDQRPGPAADESSAALFARLAAGGRFDSKRVFLFGFSSSGAAVLDQALKEPEAHAGAISICHIHPQPAATPAALGLPVLIVTGPDDGNHQAIMTIATERYTHHALSLHDVPGLGHQLRAEEAPLIADWMVRVLAQRGGNKKH